MLTLCSLDESMEYFMEWKSPLLDKSFTFAVRVVKLCRHIQQEKKEYVLTKQLLKSGTSIGANIEEATQGQSRRDFISKLSIALKEAHETRFWLRLLLSAELCSFDEVNQYINDVQEII